MKKKVHQLSVEDTFDDSFRLFAIFSDEEDYRLAYLLNIHLNLYFKKAYPITEPISGEKFSFFEYKDATHYRNWFLLQNWVVQQAISKEQVGLFDTTEILSEKKVWFFNEWKKARFILKIESDEEDEFFQKTTQKLKNIAQIYTIEKIEPTKLNPKKLMFF